MAKRTIKVRGYNVRKHTRSFNPAKLPKRVGGRFAKATKKTAASAQGTLFRR